MQDAKEEVRSRLNIEDVIAEYVELKRAGRNLKALSPFTSEKTPSFIVSPEKQIWHDFSSNKGGDVFSFIMEVEGMTFRESLEHLARKAGVDMSIYGSGNSAELTKKRHRLLEANSLAQRYYQQTLIKNQHAVEYVFYQRNLNRATVSEFGIGYAPNDGSALVEFLTKKGFSAKEIGEAGLCNRFGSDLFKSRMMVPLMDSTGSTIGFTARIIDSTDKNAPKYMNTPATLLYDKSRHVFGLSQAKEAIKKADQAIIVEGNIDVVSSHQAGVKQAVATAGTAMTEQHLKAVSRFTTNIVLAYDKDEAGIKAAERAIDLAQRLGIDLSVIKSFDGAKDPDELIQKDPSLWKKAITKTEPAVDWLLEQYEDRLDLSTARGKRTYSDTALKLISGLSDPIVKDHYFKLVSTKLDSSEDALKTKLESNMIEVQQKPKKQVKTTFDPENQEDFEKNSIEDSILALLLFANSLRGSTKDLKEEHFNGDDRKKLFVYLKNNVGANVSDVDKNTSLSDNYTDILYLRAEGRYFGWSEEELSHELEDLAAQLLNEKLEKQKNDLLTKLKDAEIMGDHEQVDDLLKHINKLNKEKNSGRR